MVPHKSWSRLCLVLKVSYWGRACYAALPYSAPLLLVVLFTVHHLDALSCRDIGDVHAAPRSWGRRAAGASHSMKRYIPTERGSSNLALYDYYSRQHDWPRAAVAESPAACDAMPSLHGGRNAAGLRGVACLPR